MPAEAPESPQKPQLQEGYEHLVSHACEVASFSLLWHDLEDHFHSINNQIDSRLHQLQQPTKDTDNNNNKNNPENQQNQPPPQLTVEVGSEGGDKSEAETRETRTIAVKNAKELVLYVKEHVNDGGKWRDELCGLFKEVDDAGQLVLEALKEFYREIYGGGGGNGAVEPRKSCVVVLEEFVRVTERKVEGELREEAMRVAVELREKVRVENSREVMGFLLLLVGFGLGGEFDSDEILKLFYRVLLRRQGPKQGPEWLRALGLEDKASEVIQRLIKENKRLEAVRYICAFELVNEFPPVPLLKAEKKNAKNISKLVQGGGPTAWNHATQREIRTLKRIIEVIEKYKLSSRYPSHTLRNYIQQLKMRKKERNSAAIAARSNTKSQRQNRNKRAAPASNAQQNKNKQMRIASPDASVGTAQTVDSKLPSYHEEETMNEALGQQCPNPSASTDATLKTAPHSAVVGTSGTPVGFLAGSEQITLSSENNQLADSASNTTQLNSAGFLPVCLRSMFRAMYGLSDDANGSSGLVGLPATATVNGLTPNAFTTSVPYNQSNQPRTSLDFGMETSLRTAGIAPNTTPSTFGSHNVPLANSLPGAYGASNAANMSSAQFALAGNLALTGHSTIGSYNAPLASSLPGQYGNAVNRSSAQSALAGNLVLTGRSTVGYYNMPLASSLPGQYGANNAANRSSAQSALAGNLAPTGPSTFVCYSVPVANSLPGPYGASNAANMSSAQFAFAGNLVATGPNTVGYYNVPLATSLHGPYGASNAANRSSAQFAVAGNFAPITPSTFGYYNMPLASSLPTEYGASNAANMSSAQFRLAENMASTGIASSTSMNTSLAFNLGEQLRASQYYSCGCPVFPGTSGIAPNASFNNTYAAHYE